VLNKEEGKELVQYMNLNLEIENDKVSFDDIKKKVEIFIVKLKIDIGDKYLDVIRE
jgi:hypothetical protein